MAAKGDILITGCSDDSIGSALVIEYQRLGYHVFATARSTLKMLKLRDLESVTLLELDVTDSSHIAAAVEAVTAKTGGTLDYLIHSAARPAHFLPVLDENIDTVRQLFETNVFGPLALTKAFMSLVMQSKGSIAFITSLVGHLNIPYLGTYAATKRSIELIAETLRLEVAPFGVTVTSIVTGGVQSTGQTGFDNFQLPKNSLYRPIESTIKGRAQGHDGLSRMPAEVYATYAADALIRRTQGRIWYGEGAEMVRISTTAPLVPQANMDAQVVMGTGLDSLSAVYAAP